MVGRKAIIVTRKCLQKVFSKCVRNVKPLLKPLQSICRLFIFMILQYYWWHAFLKMPISFQIWDANETTAVNCKKLILQFLNISNSRAEHFFRKISMHRNSSHSSVIFHRWICRNTSPKSLKQLWRYDWKCPMLRRWWRSAQPYIRGSESSLGCCLRLGRRTWMLSRRTSSRWGSYHPMYCTDRSSRVGACFYWQIGWWLPRLEYSLNFAPSSVC